MLTGLQEQTIKAIVNVFETGLVLGDYSSITLIPRDTGGLTYGRSQTTLNGGGLHDLVADYVADPRRPYAQALAAYVPRLEARDPALNQDAYLKNLLRATADYEVMRDIQDRFFDSFYWAPALAKATKLGIVSPLGVAVVYDSFVHGSFDQIAGRANGKAGTVGTAGERAWIAAYVEARRDWLSTSARADLRATVYRMAAFGAVIAAGAWSLPLPLVVQDAKIDLSTLAGSPQRVYEGPEVGSRDLSLGSTVMSGRDVRALQVALTSPAAGENLKADAHFGQLTSAAVQRVQGGQHLPRTGIADAAVFHALGFGAAV